MFRGIREEVLLARRFAVDALERMERTSCHAQDAIHELARKHTLSPPDRAFLWELVHGVVRRRDTIDRILTVFSRVKLKKVHLRVLCALRIAVYQLVWLDRIPDSAAVYESVEIVKARFPGWIVSFANGCLRAVARAIDIKVAGVLSRTDARRAVPISGGRHCLFVKPIFPDPETDPAASLSARHGYPRWLVERWLDAFGPETTDEILRAGNVPPTLWLRPEEGGLAALSRELRKREIRHETEEDPPAIRLLDPVGRLDELPGYAAGRFVVQDRSAMIPVHLLAPRPKERVLDVCAAPGGKTTQIARGVGPEGLVVALDRDADRLERLTDTLGRLRFTNVAIVVGDARDPSIDLGGEPFDRVLVDAPCSNTAVLAKRVEARHRVTPALVDSLVEVQTAILEAAATRVRPGGVLVYSTCALLPEENDDLVDDFLEAHPEFTLADERETLPREAWADGGYAARLERAREGEGGFGRRGGRSL